MPPAWILFAISAALLAGGVEGFARAADRIPIPARFRILLAGIGFALPPILVAFVAGLDIYPKLAVAVLLGSSIANVGLVLSLSTLTRPLEAKSPQVQRAIPLVLGFTLLLWFLARDNQISGFEGGLLLASGIGAACYLIRIPAAPPRESAPDSTWTMIVLALTGLGWAIGAAILLARSCTDSAGLIPETGIGGTAFAFAILGPALAARGAFAGILAARAGDGDAALGGIACGTILTSSLGFGVLALAQPLVVIVTVVDAFPAALVSALFLLAIRINRNRTSRWEGLLQLAAYAGFVAWVLR